ADRHVVSVRIPERELHGPGIWVHFRLLFEPGNEGSCPLQGRLIIVDPKKQEKPITRGGRIRARQRGVLVRTPLVQADQDGSILIQDLPPVLVGRSGLGLAKKRLVPFETTANVTYADDRPSPYHWNPSAERGHYVTAMALLRYGNSCLRSAGE